MIPPRFSRFRGLLAACGCAALGCLAAQAQSVPAGTSAPAPSGPEWTAARELPPYQPQQIVSGKIRLWARSPLVALIKDWQKSFSHFHPAVTYDVRTYGTASVIGAIYEGVADCGILGEEIHPDALAAFEQVKHHEPLGIEIATGSLDVKGCAYAQTFFVNQDNPLSHITLAQLDGILGTEHRRGSGVIRTWGDLGLQGEWASHSIQPYSWLLAESFCLYLQHAVLAGSHRWNNQIKEFVTITRPDGTSSDDGQQILEALAKDRYGIAVSNVRYAKPGLKVKPLALGLSPNGPFYLPTKADLIDQTYPLTRIIPLFTDREPGQPVDPKVKEFIRFILSREGQEALARSKGYLPINRAVAAEQLRKLQ